MRIINNQSKLGVTKNHDYQFKCLHCDAIIARSIFLKILTEDTS